MPCYNYTSNEPIYFEPNLGPWSIERVYNIGDTYSYSSIARMCEIPAQDQLCVYTRPTPTGTETRLTFNLDYTIDTTLERIVLINTPGSGQVVIRRCTSNSKMFIPFTEGAKLTAQQLNTSLYQLLFITQEREFVNASINEYYPIAITAPTWSSGTAYVQNNYVLSGNTIYRCIANHTASGANTPPNTTFWAVVNPASNGFVIEGGTTISGPIKFNLQGVTNGSGLIWDGTQFQAGTLKGLLSDLTDVSITAPVQDNNLLRYDGTVSKWKNVIPKVDLTLAQPVFAAHIFTDQTLSYRNDSVTLPTMPNSLNAFRTGVGGNWNITSVPTVWHILNELTPGYILGTPATYFDSFLSNIATVIDSVSTAVANPVKIKFFWNLNKNRINKADTTNTSENLQNYKSTFWDSPEELYHIDMWTLVTNLKYHGVVNNDVYRDNPYFSAIGSTFTSKLTGYGIQAKGFYLSVPECYTTSLVKIPIIKDPGNPVTNSSHTFTQVADLTNTKLTGLKFSSPGDTGIYSDVYLENLRNLAFAGSFLKPGGSYQTDTTDLVASMPIKDAEARARWAKGNLFSADYNGFQDISYRRLEIADTNYEGPKSCLFKIPKQIIYYNKHALAFASNVAPTFTSDDVNFPNIDDSLNSSSLLSKQTRFTGPGDLNYTANTNSTVTTQGMGTKFKSDAFWSNWCNAWSGDLNYRFNEADIDWIVSNLSLSEGTVLNLYSPWNTTRYMYGGVPQSGVLTGYVLPSRTFPWPYRTNYFDKTLSAFDGYIGHHLMNVDYNKIFSESTNYVPDPRDEYVFRLVANRTLTNSFKKIGSSDIASSIILEHGFSDKPNNASVTGIELASDIYAKNNILNDSKEVRSRLNRNDIKVFIQNEHLERYDSNPNNLQYVITLCISVPRLKSIGYSRIYRKPLQTNSNSIMSPIYAGGGAQPTIDIENDLGPWNFYMLETDGLLAAESTVSNNVVTINNLTNSIFDTYSNTTAAQKIMSPIGGRNECAVKFVRLGIPSDLWIRLSVLNTDGTTSLINTNGGWN